MTQPPVPGVTVIVCCYNSSARLVETLKHLSEQRLPPEIQMEVLIVDNASDDDLERAVNQSWKPVRSDYSLRVVKQPISGLAHARMKGVAEASFDYAIFCDDDNWLCPTYVATVHSLLRGDPRIGIVGGASTPTSERELPSWFFNNAYVYAVGTQHERSGDITQRHYVWGAGMGFYLPFLRKAFEAGLRPILADRMGNALLSGNDTELCFWFIEGNYLLWYDERLQFQHYIPPARLELEYANKVKEGFRQIEPVLRSYKSFLVLRGKMNSCETASLAGWTQGAQRYVKAIVGWFLTDRSTRAKIRNIRKAIHPFSFRRSTSSNSNPL